MLKVLLEVKDAIGKTIQGVAEAEEVVIRFMDDTFIHLVPKGGGCDEDNVIEVYDPWHKWSDKLKSDDEIIKYLAYRPYQCATYASLGIITAAEGEKVAAARAAIELKQKQEELARLQAEVAALTSKTAGQV